MPSIVRRVLSELRRGENLDTYATIAVAVVLAVLNLVGAVPSSKLSGVLLAVLALLAVGTLATRAKLDVLASQRQDGTSPPLLTEFPASYESHLAGPGDIYLAGISLTTVIPEHLHNLESRLRAGAQVRVLLVNPGTPAAELAERRMAIPPDSGRRDLQINGTLTHLRWLADTTHGHLDIRLTDQELPIGWVFIEPTTSKSTLYLQYYAFRTRHRATMRMVLRPSDAHWYDTYREQLEEYWSDAEPLASPTI